MKNSTTTFIIGWIFLISSFFFSYGINLICASIYFSAHYIIESLKDKNNSLEKLKIFHVEYADNVLIECSTIILALDYNSAVEKFKKDYKGKYLRIKNITEQNK